ncbi:ATP-binding protein [Desulfogranum japonicum]|uniref:ATP-binding protein n=1 Tax=Desulfogranum japonicum TaxID=231447 RepID=UPI0003F6D907|nr:ATP-binding protein [Desulfogranum japonicum]
MKANHPHAKLHALVSSNEDWLMNSILHYAIEYGYAAYTSTLVEPWRLSISGLSEPLLKSLTEHQDNLELHPDEDYTNDMIASFGILEAQRHRQRGVTLPMFLGFFKYYRQSYLDLLELEPLTPEEKKWASHYLERFFDRIELGLVHEWTSSSDAAKIQELQVANRNITNEKNKYLTLFESLSQPVILLNDQGILDRINHAAAQWLQVANDKRFYSIDSSIHMINQTLFGKKYDEIFPWLQGIIHKLNDSQKVIVEHHSILKNDRQLEIDVLCSAMCDISRKFNGFLLVFSDNTHEYNLIAEQKKLHIERLQANKLESIGQLASGIAHEINTPLQFVSSNIEFLSDSFVALNDIITTLADAAQKEHFSSTLFEECLEKADWSYLESEIPIAVKQSREGITRVTSIVQAMKEFSHPGRKEFELLDLNHLIEVTTTISKNEWKYCAELVLDLAPDLPQIPCLANEIGQVLLNLLVNSAHTIQERIESTENKEPGLITIKTELEGSVIVIHISDTGCGIPKAIQPRIFDPFFTTKAVGKGTGQGLAIAYNVIATKHGGSLSFQTIPGRGTTFTIKLPIKRPGRQQQS